MILDEILESFYNTEMHDDFTHLELSTSAFNKILEEFKDRLVAPNQAPKDDPQKMTINGKPIQLIQDDDIWFEWK